MKYLGGGVGMMGKMPANAKNRKIPYIIGPNILFANSRNPGAISYEKDICNSTHCLLHFTESDWYRRLIVKKPMCRKTSAYSYMALSDLSIARWAT